MKTETFEVEHKDVCTAINWMMCNRTFSQTHKFLNQKMKDSAGETEKTIYKNAIEWFKNKYKQ